MMLHYLTPLNFANYGSIVEETDADLLSGRNLLHLTEANLQKDLFYRCDDAVYISVGSSMMVLRVKHAYHGDTVKAYYLDRTVRIDPGILFQVSPLNAVGSYSIYLNQDVPLCAVRHEAPKEDCTIESRMALKEIFTLFYQEKGKSFNFKGEIHRQSELVYVDVGELHNSVNANDYTLSQGDMMLIGPYQWHSQYTDADHQACFVTITFDWDCEYMQLLLNRVIHLQNEQMRLLKAMIEESHSTDIFNQEFIICYLKQLLLSLVRQARSGVEPPREQKLVTVNCESAVVDQAMAYVEAHIYNRLTVSEVASHVNVSASHLSALFQKSLHISPSEYFRRRKLEKSKALIREGNLNFTEIAEKLSYASVHHFSNQFKSTYGISPTEYSRSLK